MSSELPPEVQKAVEDGERAYWKNLKQVYLDALLRMGTDEDTPPAALVSAAKEVLDRVDGKVTEKVELQGDFNLRLDLGPKA